MRTDMKNQMNSFVVIPEARGAKKRPFLIFTIFFKPLNQHDLKNIKGDGASQMDVWMPVERV